MNEIVSGPVSAVPLTTTHSKTDHKVIDSPAPYQDKVIQDVTVVDV